jgi:hypothetical protein
MASPRNPAPLFVLELFGNFKFPQAESSQGLIANPWLGSANFRLKAQNA